MDCVGPSWNEQRCAFAISQQQCRCADATLDPARRQIRRFLCLNYNIIKFLTNYEIKHIERIEKIINMCEKINLKIDYKISNDITMIMGSFTDGIYEGKIGKDSLEKAVRTFKKLNLYPLVFHCENGLGEISESYSNGKTR
jgi:hypothetical protein